ncbi:hypothetical protein DFR70_109241 [Nocardia tenerifensis]|uniref:Uncharacterized protein n=1 Tax=Nocardia tenerifensis TaxID=228006 RepID=A0A318JXB2_9NOCA|nr:hypothetical protein [Nocardia tenerifensis]PXX61050.1 hypothetical protein DFR70_109241 [Nocardia tenerifensis]
MDILVTLVALAICAIAVWGAISFWTEGGYDRHEPERTAHGPRLDDDDR